MSTSWYFIEAWNSWVGNLTSFNQVIWGPIATHFFGCMWLGVLCLFSSVTKIKDPSVCHLSAQFVAQAEMRGSAEGLGLWGAVVSECCWGALQPHPSVGPLGH